MRKMTLMMTVLAMGVAGAVSAQPAASQQDRPQLTAAQWEYVMKHSVNAKPIIGKPVVYFLNATGEEIDSVVCDAKWTLIGPQPYNHEAPGSLPAWSATYVDVHGFDGWCKSSLLATTATGDVYKVSLSGADFSGSTFLTISERGKQ